MSTVAELWMLQVTDLAVETHRRRLADLEQQLAAPAELLDARQAAAAAEAELTSWRSKQRTIETQVRDLAQHIQAAEKQLMSGRVRNPKELEGMEANLNSLKRRRAGLEDEILEIMLEIDRQRTGLETQRSHLAGLEQAWQTQQAALIQERDRQTAELHSLSAQLARQWAAISPADQELYRSLRQRKAGLALSLMQRGTCRACGVSLPTSAVQHVQAENQRVFCPTCGRLLHSA